MNDTETRTIDNVNISCGLHRVEHQAVPFDHGQLQDAVTSRLRELNIEPLWLQPPTFLDPVDGRCGLAFGLDKLGGLMEKLPNQQFRYRSDEVETVLVQLVTDLNLRPVIRWDRGMGVFVYNLYFGDHT